MADEMVATVLMIYAASEVVTTNKPKKRKQRKVWVKPWLTRRTTNSTYQRVDELCLTDKEEYRCYLQMNTKALTAPGVGYSLYRV